MFCGCLERADSLVGVFGLRVVWVHVACLFAFGWLAKFDLRALASNFGWLVQGGLS